MEDEDFSTDDDLRPDASDRRPTKARARKQRVSGPKLPVSRQHLIMGIGILVLLLVIISIGSALKSPDKSGSQPQTTDGGARDINLSGSSSLAGGNTASNVTDTNDGSGVSNSSLNGGGQPQNVSVPPISPTPTQAAPQQQPANQQRVDLPGNLSDALSPPANQAPNQVNNLIQSTLPTEPATLAGRTQGTVPTMTTGSSIRPVQARPSAPATSKPTTKPRQERPAATKPQQSTPTRTASASKPAAPARSSAAPATTATRGGATAGGSASAFKSASGSHYTLQLSGASRPDSLNAFAKQQKLSNYVVYETTRNGKPWYVLVNGIYASPAAAKQAVASLPAEVQAKQPWARSLSQVQKELK